MESTLAITVRFGNLSDIFAILLRCELKFCEIRPFNLVDFLRERKW